MDAILIILLIVVALYYEWKKRKSKKVDRTNTDRYWNNPFNKLSDNISNTETPEDYGLYEPRYNFIDSTGYKEELNAIRQLQKDAIKYKTAVDYFDGWQVDGSKAKGKKMTNGNIKVILRCFNSECEAAINKLTFKNIETTKKRIRSSFDQLNKAFETKYEFQIVI